MVGVAGTDVAMAETAVGTVVEDVEVTAVAIVVVVVVVVAVVVAVVVEVAVVAGAVFAVAEGRHAGRAVTAWAELQIVNGSVLVVALAAASVAVRWRARAVC